MIVHNKPDISVIMPVYNGQEYIKNGINYVLQQSLRDIELIIVNDGSTDNTARICDEVAKSDSRVVVLHEQHKGVAHARQIGINNVCGKYTIQLDADDSYAPTTLEKMFIIAERESAEMVICDIKEKKKNELNYKSQKPSDVTREAIANDMVCAKLHGGLGNKLIKTSCFKANGVVFRQELTMREDMFFILDILPYIDKIAYLPEALYTYDRTREANSLTNTYMVDVINFYCQEMLFHSLLLRCALVSKEQRNCMRNLLLMDAYTTLIKNVFEKEKWYEILTPYKDEISKARASIYNKSIVRMALDNNYAIARRIGVVVETIRRKREGRMLRL